MVSSNHLAIAEQMIAHYNAQDADATVALMNQMREFEHFVIHSVRTRKGMNHG